MQDLNCCQIFQSYFLSYTEYLVSFFRVPLDQRVKQFPSLQNSTKVFFNNHDMGVHQRPLWFSPVPNQDLNNLRFLCNSVLFIFHRFYLFIHKRDRHIDIGKRRGWVPVGSLMWDHVIMNWDKGRCSTSEVLNHPGVPIILSYIISGRSSALSREQEKNVKRIHIFALIYCRKKYRHLKEITVLLKNSLFMI